MKYFLDSAKLDEIKEAYNTFGIDGVTTNPKHIMNSGKPFLEAIGDIAAWLKEEGLTGDEETPGWEVFPVSVEINPHIDDADEMVKAARKISSICGNFVIKIPSTIEGITAARRLEAEGIRTNLTLVFSAAQAILPGKIGCLFVSPFIGWKEANGEDCKKYIRDIGQKNVIFPGHITDAEVLALYHCANIFLCMSEHEGFCQPLYESMYFHVPIIAYAAAAIPDG